jgi:hypothetical protein
MAVMAAPGAVAGVVEPPVEFFSPGQRPGHVAQPPGRACQGFQVPGGKRRLAGCCRKVVGGRGPVPPGECFAPGRQQLVQVWHARLPDDAFSVLPRARTEQQDAELLEAAAGDCEDGRVESLLEFLSDKWWLVFPLSAFAGHYANSWRKASERRHQRKVELYTLKNQAREAEKASAAEVEALMAAHDATNRRWLDYELDVGKLIDFPLMTDVREPLTVAFLRAKREADGQRPASASDITSPARLEAYRQAVNSFAVALDVAEREARRIRDSKFSGPERERLATARKLLMIAENHAATPAERQAAYKRARRELDGLIVLPDVTIAALEERVAPGLDAGRQPSESGPA